MEDKKMKKLITITTAITLLIYFSTVSAHAGAARRHTIEGFMLGTGVAILTAALYNGSRQQQPNTDYTQDNARNVEACYPGHRYGHWKKNHKKHRHHRPRGHWEVDRIWVDPVYEKKWNPGHYNRRGGWVSGRHEEFLVSDGYWQEEKVWVRY